MSIAKLRDGEPLPEWPVVSDAPQALSINQTDVEQLIGQTNSLLGLWSKPYPVIEESGSLKVIKVHPGEQYGFSIHAVASFEALRQAQLKSAEDYLVAVPSPPHEPVPIVLQKRTTSPISDGAKEAHNPAYSMSYTIIVEVINQSKFNGTKLDLAILIRRFTGIMTTTLEVTMEIVEVGDKIASYSGCKATQSTTMACGDPSATEPEGTVFVKRRGKADTWTVSDITGMYVLIPGLSVRRRPQDPHDLPLGFVFEAKVTLTVTENGIAGKFVLLLGGERSNLASQAQ